MASVANLLLRVTGNADDARRELDAMKKEVRGFDRTEAEAELRVAAAEARAELKRTVEEVKDFGSLSPTARLDLAAGGVQAEIDKVRARLADLSQQEASPKVDIATAAALAKIERLEAKLAAIRDERVNVEVNVDRDGSARAGLLGLIDRLTGVDAAAGGAGGGLTSAGVAAGSMGGRAGTLLGIVALLGPALVGVGAALVAMVGSLAAAAGGFGALGIAAGGALAGGLALGIGAMSRYKATVGETGSAANLLKQSYDRLGVAFQNAVNPASIAVFQGLRVLLTNIRGPVTYLQAAFSVLGVSIKTALIGAVGAAESLVASFGGMVRASAPLAGPLVNGLIALAQVLVNIATAAMPFLVSGARQVAAGLQSWAASTGNTQALSDTIGGLVSHLSSWANLARQIGSVMVAFFSAVAPQGQSLVDTLARGADSLAEWLRSGPGLESIKAFFAAVVPLGIQFVEAIARLALGFAGLVQAVAPVFTPILEGINSLLTQFPILGVAIAGIVTVLGLLAAGAALWSVAATAAGAATAIFGTALAVLTSPITLIVLAIAALVLAGIALYRNWDEIKGKAAEAWAAIKANVIKPVTEAVTAVKTKFTEMKTAVLARIGEITLGAIRKFNEAKTGISHAVTNTINWVKTKWAEAKTAVIARATEIKNSAVSRFSEAKTSISNAMTNAKTAVVSKFTEMKTSASSKLGEVKTTIASKVKEWAPTIRAKVGEFVGAGRAIIEGLAKGISDAAQKVYAKISEIARNVASRAKSALSIRSPSRVFFEIGENISAGLAQGIAAGADDVLRAVQRDLAGPLAAAIPSSLGAQLSAGLDVSALTTPAVSGAGGASTYLTQHITVPTPVPSQGSADTNDMLAKLSLALGQQGASTRR